MDSIMYKAGYKLFRIYTISHIHRYTGSQEEGVGSGSVLSYKKAPVSRTGHPLPLEAAGPRVSSSPTDIPTGVPQLGSEWFCPEAGEERMLESFPQGQPLSRFILQHAFNQIEELVMFLCL